ncbi:MAG: TonB-dependent receptor, partial [Novosphingobium sp.]
TVYDIEVGVKSQLFDRKLTINAAAYNQWYKDIQRTLSFGSPLRSLVINAGGATIRGGEVEVTAAPVPWLDLSASAAYSNARYTDFFRAELGDLSGNYFAMAPEFTYTLSGQLHIPVPESVGKLDLGASYYHQSSIYVSDLNQGAFTDIPIKAYGVLDLTADWRNVAGYPVDLGAYVKNVTKQRYYTGGATVYPSTGTSGYIMGEPRRWGVSLTYHFGAMARR